MTLSATYQGAAAAPARPPIFEPGALAERVQCETRVFAENSPVGSLDGSGLRAKMLAQELLERALADETDAGAIRLVEYRQAGRMRQERTCALRSPPRGKSVFDRAEAATPCRK